MTPTKLSKLLIGEVSGVDDPANQLRGWLVTKSRGWDSAAAEARIRKATGADEAPTPAYASCFLWNSGDGETLPANFEAYKFLVADATEDGELALSLDAVRAVKSTYADSDIPEDHKAAVGELVEQLEARMVEEQDARKTNTSIVGKIKALLTGKEDIDMTKEELQAELDERFASLDEKLEALSKSVEAPAPAGEEAPATEAADEQTPAEETAAAVLTAEDVAKTIEEQLAPVVEAISKTLDRVAVVEERLAIRKSLDGQEDGETGEQQKPTLSDAMTAAFKGRAVTLS